MFLKKTRRRTLSFGLGGGVGRAVLGTNPRPYSVEIEAAGMKTQIIYQRVYSPILARALGFSSDLRLKEVSTWDFTKLPDSRKSRFPPHNLLLAYSLSD